MQCVHCRAWNEEEERRCARCGRRLHASALLAIDTYPLTDATAPALEALEGGRPQEAASASPPVPARGDYQPWLFRDPSLGAKVVSIPTLTQRQHAGGERKVRGKGASRPADWRLNPAARRVADSQQSLDFRAGAAHDHSLGME